MTIRLQSSYCTATTLSSSSNWLKLKYRLLLIFIFQIADCHVYRFAFVLFWNIRTIKLCWSWLCKSEFFRSVEKLFSLLKNGWVLHFDIVCQFELFWIKKYLKSEGTSYASSEEFFSLFTNRKTRGKFEFERTSCSAWGRLVFELGEHAGVWHVNLLASIFQRTNPTKKMSATLKLWTTSSNFPVQASRRLW